MKFINQLMVICIGITFLWGCQPSETTPQEPEEEESPIQNGINWEGENETANYLAMQGLWHYMNAEFSNAYVLFEKAVDLDSSLFACHTTLARMSRGEKREYHKEMAKKYVEGENETSQLYVSILDTESDSTGVLERREIWAKMYELTNGPYVHYGYAFTRTDREEALEVVDKLIVFVNEIGLNPAPVYNAKGYILHRQGNTDEGVEAIEKYMELYPEGYNPLDSRAEFYLYSGDTARAIEYYEKVLEQFPYSTSARSSLRDLREE